MNESDLSRCSAIQLVLELCTFTGIDKYWVMTFESFYSCILLHTPTCRYG